MLVLFTLIITGTGFVACAAFVIRYWLLSGGAWRRTEVGRFLMSFMANHALLFLLILVGHFFPNWPGQTIVTIIWYITYVAQAWWPLRLLLKSHRGAGDD